MQQPQENPYTLNEVRLVLERHKAQMNAYHWSLMDWLYKRVISLEKEKRLQDIESDLSLNEELG